MLTRVKFRMQALDQIDSKLQEMCTLAEKARSREITHEHRLEINHKLDQLKAEVHELDILTKDDSKESYISELIKT